MADTKISALTEDTAPVGADYLVSVDTSDTTMDVSGSNKKVQVGTLLGLIGSRPTAQYATTATLSATYSNGTSGVGATLTNSSAAAIGSLDGQTISNGSSGQVILVKDQSTQAQNGLYTLTTAGGPGLAWVMTRHGLMDSSGEFVGAVVAVQLGTLAANTLWGCQNTAAPTIGTTAITFSQVGDGAGLGTFVVQTSTAAPANSQVLASLATGILKVTTTTGVLSVATAGTDYVTPTGSGSGLTSLNASNLASGTIPAARGNILQTDTDGTTITFNLALGNLHTVTLGGNRTLALSNVTTGQTFTLVLKQDGTGSRTISAWFSGISWAGGSAPTLTTTASKSDAITFICTASGAYLGAVAFLNA